MSDERFATLFDTVTFIAAILCLTTCSVARATEATGHARTAKLFSTPPSVDRVLAPHSNVRVGDRVGRVHQERLLAPVRPIGPVAPVQPQVRTEARRG
jgi:hypothetical protein